jgi:hypothetical protein
LLLSRTFGAVGLSVAFCVSRLTTFAGPDFDRVGESTGADGVRRTAEGGGVSTDSESIRVLVEAFSFGFGVAVTIVAVDMVRERGILFGSTLGVIA